MKFHKKDRVKMRKIALENYGKEYKNVVFIINSSAYNIKQHPGYDMGVSPMGLHDLKFEKSGDDLNFSLYDWELKTA